MDEQVKQHLISYLDKLEAAVQKGADIALVWLTGLFWITATLTVAAWLYLGFTDLPKSHRMPSEGAVSENMSQTIKEKTDAP